MLDAKGWFSLLLGYHRPLFRPRRQSRFSRRAIDILPLRVCSRKRLRKTFTVRECRDNRSGGAEREERWMIKVVLVGCGAMSKAWLDAARQIAGLAIVGLVDLD